MDNLQNHVEAREPKSEHELKQRVSRLSKLKSPQSGTEPS